jgi:hypothetical protein
VVTYIIILRISPLSKQIFDEVSVDIDLLSFGNETLSCDVNCSIFLAVQKYIKETCRFSIS